MFKRSIKDVSMIHLLLVVIYLSFISLGLPDALLGSAWPTMYPSLEVPVSYAGIISFIIAFGTIVSSLNSDRLTRCLGTGKVTFFSVLTTAVALFGFSISTTFLSLSLWAVPYGLGAGSVDAALNNYVALHYKSRHMSWLHCMWGIGASIGPSIMGAAMAGGGTWKEGYRIISILQIVLTAVLLFSLPLWKKEGGGEDCAKEAEALSFREILSTNGVKEILLCFFCYSAVEQTTGLWAASFLTLSKGVPASVAASLAGMFFIGITIGRGICGFITMKLDDTQMIRMGQIVISLGIVILILPLDAYVSLLGFVMIGLGCAPIYPSIIHSTPSHFGAEKSQAIIGVQMAMAYVGTCLMPPLFGLIAEHITVSLLPYYLSLSLLLMVVMHEMLIRKLGRR